MRNQLLSLFIIGHLSLYGQIINRGHLHIESGAVFYAEPAIKNQSIIENVGSIHCEGDLLNDGSLLSEGGSEIQFLGTENQDFLPGYSPLAKMTILKYNSNVQLSGDLTVQEGISLPQGNGKLRILDNILYLSEATTITDYNSDRYLMMSPLSQVRKGFSSATMFTFPVGGDEYSPLTCDLSGSAMSADAYISVGVDEDIHPDLLPTSTDYLNRYWIIKAVGMETYLNNVEGVYLSEDASGDIAKIKGSTHDGMDWSFLGGDAGTSSITGTVMTDSIAFTGQNFHGRIAARVFLDGAYDEGDQVMSSNLIAEGFLPVLSPYGDGITVESEFFTTHNDIVDWIYISARDADDISQSIAGVSAFLKSDGSIMNAQGGTDLFLKDVPLNNYLVVSHRNHLPVATASSVAMDGSAGVIDFTAASTDAYGNHARKNRNGVLTAWPGDVNGNSNIRFQGSENDADEIGNTVLLYPDNVANFPTYAVPGYLDTDINLDGKTKLHGADNDLDIISNAIRLHPGNVAVFPTFTINSTINE